MEIYIAIIGTITTVITICLTNYFSKRSQLKFEERKLKEQYYLKFIEALSDNVLLDDQIQARNAHAYARNRIILIASSNVVNLMLDYENAIRETKRIGDTEETALMHDITLTELFKAMRIDLFGKSRAINKNYPLIGIFGAIPHAMAKNKMTSNN